MVKDSYYQNKNVLVIGGSFGIGEELCKDLADLGANLAISARSKDKIEKLAKSLGKKHLHIACDITEEKEVATLSRKLFTKWSKVDLVIFCAGTYKPMNLGNFDLKIAKEIVNVNFTSLLNFIDVFLPKFKEKKISHLAIVSSVSGYFGMPNSLAYGSSKAGLSNLTESLFYELRKYKTKVQLINPGFVKTRLTDQNKFTMPGRIMPNKAAKIILKNLPKRKFEITLPFIFTFMFRVLSILPYKVRFFLFKNAK